MALYILGDIHFSSFQPWRLPLGDAFLRWFADLQLEADSSLLVLGDYTDSALLPGREIAQLARFARLAKKKVSKVFFLVGNHDLKLYKDIPQLSFEFVEQEGIQILKEPAEVLDIDGIKVLSLPHYNYRTDIPSMWEHYSNLPQHIRDQHYDLVVGHFSDTSTQLFDHMIDISYLKASHIVLGHQHIRTSPHYTGSVFPCKISEDASPKPRALWRYEKKDDVVIKKELPLPIFGEYKTVEYPKPLPKTTADITIWTVTGCESEKLAQDFYGNIYIKNVVPQAAKRDATITGSDDTFELNDPVEVFNEWMKTSKTPISRTVASLVRKVLKKSESVVQEPVSSTN